MITVTVNGVPHELTGGDTLALLLAARRTPWRGVAVAVDGQVVPRAAWTATVLCDGATVEILTATQGG